VGRHLQTGQIRRAAVFFVDYEFTGPDGQLRRGRSRVFGVEYDRFGLGARVLVRVRANDFDTHALALAAPVLDDWRLRSLAITLALLGLMAAVGYGSDMVARRRAARFGRLRDVRVTAHRRALTGRMAFGWEDASGATGWSPSLPARHLPPLGATVTLWIDPRRGWGWPEALL
jgi:hypothetical protein